jgi:asparagine synthetase B (glutamine-hydrolysing)
MYIAVFVNHQNILSSLEMCGIFCCVSPQGYATLDDNTIKTLKHRGPDSFRQHDVNIKELFLTFVSTVLSLRSHQVVSQPLIDKNGSVLCWNGEAWSFKDKDITGNDTDAVSSRLQQAISHEDIISVFSAIRGPYACVYYHSTQHRLYFGRDCLGRRSLVTAITALGDRIIASVPTDTTLQWSEIDAEGIFYIDLDDIKLIFHLVPFKPESESSPACIVSCL